MTTQKFKKPSQKSIAGTVNAIVGEFIDHTSPLTNHGDGGVKFTFSKNKSRINTVIIIKVKNLEVYNMEIHGKHSNGKTNVIKHESLTLSKIADILQDVKSDLKQSNSKLMEQSILTGVLTHPVMLEFKSWFDNTAAIIK